MKRIMACFLALVLAFCTVGAMAAGRENKLVVGSTTALSGNFFSPAFGSNTSDLDVQTLLHGYHLVKWNGDEGSYVLNDRVVTSLVKTEDSQGNRTYTLTLCEDLRYSDGTPITARDYAFSILLNASAQMAEIGGAADGWARRITRTARRLSRACACLTIPTWPSRSVRSIVPSSMSWVCWITRPIPSA